MPEVLKSKENGGTENRKMRPITIKERIAVIDILRGVAILGILMLNIFPYSFPERYQGIYLKIFDGIADQTVYWFLQLFGRGKFVTMLSFLFGLGMAVQVTRAYDKGGKMSLLYSRRLLVLLAIGLLHDVGLWGGIILVMYSIMGFFLLPFQKRRPKTLLTWAVISFLIPTMIMVVRFQMRRPPTPSTPPGQTQTSAAAQQPGSAAQKQAKSQKELQKEKDKRRELAIERQKQKANEIIETHRNGSYWDMVVYRLEKLKRTLIFTPRGGWNLLGLFLLGVWTWQKGIFQDIEKHLKFLERTRWVSLVSGGGATGVYFLLSHIIRPAPGLLLPAAMNILYLIGTTGLCLFYVSVIVLLTREDRWKRFLKPLAAVGRMALSNYVFQSVVCTAFFYGYGFNMFAKTSPVVNFLLVFPVFALQIWLSAWWSRRFRFGPLEWLWRSLSYGKRQPMRLKEKKDTI